MNRILRALLVVVIASVCLIACAVPPMRVSRKVMGPNPGPLQSPDTGFIAAGKTSQAEMEERLGAVKIYQDESLFIARWVESSWTDPGADRVWGAHTVVASFDEKHLVKQFCIRNDSCLSKELMRFFPEQHPLESAVVVPAEVWLKQQKFTEIHLAENDITLNDRAIARSDIGYRSPRGFGATVGNDPDPRIIEVRLKLHHSKEEVYLRFAAADYLTFAKWYFR